MKTKDNVEIKPTTNNFSPAVTPVAGTTIHTDTEGLHTSETTIPSLGKELPAYLARPQKYTGKLPVVLVVQEIFGVHEHIRDICRRLAKQGYLAIAPELYFRQGDPNKYTDIGELFSKLVNKVPDNQVLSDLDHTAHWASQNGGDASKLAITGFCWGGRITWMYAAHNPQLKVGVAWYGVLAGDNILSRPTQPVDEAANLIAPVLGLYGGKDKSIPQESIEKMRQAIRAANADAEIVVYPEADHAFNADYRPTYHPEAAADGWQRMLDWFAKYGVK